MTDELIVDDFFCLMFEYFALGFHENQAYKINNIVHIMHSYVLQKHRYDNCVKPLFHLRSGPLDTTTGSPKLWEATSGQTEIVHSMYSSHT